MIEHEVEARLLLAAWRATEDLDDAEYTIRNLVLDKFLALPPDDRILVAYWIGYYMETTEDPDEFHEAMIECLSIQREPNGGTAS